MTTVDQTPLLQPLLQEGLSAKVPNYCLPGARDHYKVTVPRGYPCRDICVLMASGTICDGVHLHKNLAEKTVEIQDARELEVAEGLSKKDFFHKYGFVLLDHKTAMSAEDWLLSEYDVLDGFYRYGEFKTKDTPCALIYNKEVEDLLRVVLPSATEFFATGRGIRRGPGGSYQKTFASLVHTDFPLDYDTFKRTNRWLDFDEQTQRFEDSDAAALFVINLWRPILPMQGPVVANTLAFIDPKTVRVEEFVQVDQTGQFAEGQTQMLLRHSPNHRWYYYPNITTDEVIVWKQNHFPRGAAISEIPVPHTAFMHPAAPKDAELRVSFEHRVGVLCSTRDGQ